MENPANGGAPNSQAGRSDASEYTPPITNTQRVARVIRDEVVYLPCSDECCYRLGQALRKGRIARDSWSFNFVRSILRHSKRPAWVPSPKQLSAMRKLVAELAAPDEDLIDGGDDDWAA